MRTRFNLLTLTAVFALVSLSGLNCSSGNSSTVLADDLYPDLDPPGLNPRLFAPGLISTPDHGERDITWSPDSREIYFSRDYHIVVSRYTDGAWQDAVPARFASEGSAECEAYISPDGNDLYFISQRPTAEGEDSTAFQLWTVPRSGDSWGEPRRFTAAGDFYPSMIGGDTLYFTDAKNDLHCTALKDGEATARVRLSDSINTAKAEYNAFVAPDGSYLLFTSHGWSETSANGQLYVSFRRSDGSWDLPRNLGSGINKTGVTYCPSVSRDGKYLFFSARWQGTEDIYWIDAGILDSARHNDLNFRDQLHTTLISDGAASLDSELKKFSDRYNHFCDFDAQFLMSLGDQLLFQKQTDLAATVYRYSAERFPDDRTLPHNLKLALLGDDPTSFDLLQSSLSKDTTLSLTEERAINLLGYQLMGIEMLPEATQLFKMNVDLFPASANVYDSYAEALLAATDTAGAIEHYNRSLELNPDSENARELLTQLGQL